MNLFFDTETTGIPTKGCNWLRDYDQFPWVVQLAWKTELNYEAYLIDQEEREIPSEATAVHGIRTEDTIKGMKVKWAFVRFLHDCEKAEKIIGYNIYFDTSIIKANFIREFGEGSDFVNRVIAALDKSKRVDVMWMGQKVMKKLPKLSELYYFLF